MKKETVWSCVVLFIGTLGANLCTHEYQSIRNTGNESTVSMGSHGFETLRIEVTANKVDTTKDASIKVQINIQLKK